VGSKAFGGLNRRLKEKTAESRWFETTGQASFGRAKATYWKINTVVAVRDHVVFDHGCFQAFRDKTTLQT